MYDHTFLSLQITRSDVRPHIKWAVSLVIADDHLIFLMGLCGYVWVNILTLSPSRGDRKEDDHTKTLIVLTVIRCHYTHKQTDRS